MPITPKSQPKRIEFVGSQAELQRGPNDMRQSAFPGGTVQMIGSEAVMAHKTTPMGEFDKHVRGGEQEWTGSRAELDRTPRRSWQSFDSPFSVNSESSQDTGSSFPGSGPTKMRE